MALFKEEYTQKTDNLHKLFIFIKWIQYHFYKNEIFSIQLLSTFHFELRAFIAVTFAFLFAFIFVNIKAIFLAEN